jgi:hypothetical protein
MQLNLPALPPLPKALAGSERSACYRAQVCLRHPDHLHRRADSPAAALPGGRQQRIILRLHPARPSLVTPAPSLAAGSANINKPLIILTLGLLACHRPALFFGRYCDPLRGDCLRHWRSILSGTLPLHWRLAPGCTGRACRCSPVCSEVFDLLQLWSSGKIDMCASIQLGALWGCLTHYCTVHMVGSD